ncbi:hypothetical protein FZEAL_1728 [Fusarium zealandicum]|uniref:Uncharacterized protein n=1 Tax=Fusarium zealandicum TaxID=1053134 RepID=A0A8H4USI4_9HYPO|nr:hypothetical protein FZEAL_1728 [Fusarium zealandicum]
MGSENRSIARYETTAVYTHPDAKVDIVLVHGLNGSPDKTWTAKNSTFWPLDLLPASLNDAQANVMVYGYNADVYSKRNDRSASDNFIHQHAQSLVTNLMLYRRSEGTFKNPIIWVCHSLGGVLVKRALLYSADVREAHLEDHRSVFVSTFGLVFLGTPHAGSDAATWGLVLQAMSDAIVPKRFFDSESVLLKTLKKDNETLANINSHFLDIYQRFRIHMVHENHKTDIKGSKIIIVDATSASPQLPGVTYYGIEATHSGMCKFDSMSSPGFRNVSISIRQWVQDAPGEIQVRWEVEEEERRARALTRANEIMSPFVSQSGTPSQGPSEQNHPTSAKEETPVKPAFLETPEAVPAASDQPIFVHPERFRPNSFFRGREQEMKELHKILMDNERREQGTSAVLIRSVPGGGKSHLAREYAFKHRHDYPGGVFWVRGKAPEDLEDGFSKIAKHAIARGEIEIQNEITLQDHGQVIPLVRDWLNRSENWLLILDGVLHDTPDLADCIADARNTSMILTSTDISIAGNHRFDNPRKLELGPLEEESARSLLLEETDKKKPWTQDDLDRALEVVHLMECLPLAIHAAAGQIRATREPLSKYIRSYKKRPRAGGLGAYKAVREKLQERGEMAALNLMYLLSFFSGRIPVEMLALGLGALDKRTPVRTHDSMGRRSLNKTFTVLIAFALIERDEIEDVPHVSNLNSAKPSTRSAEPLDVLKIHGIVQSFFLEALKKEGQYEFWLERAAAVFLKSFDEGDRRARENTDMGFPEDYRRYAAHCRKILKHINGLDKPTRVLIAAEKALQSRFGDIQGQIFTLARTVTADSVEGWGQGLHVSVFGRTNSASLSSSVSTTDTGKLKDGQHSLWDPQTSLPSWELNLHHYHIPYPSDSTIPAPELVEQEDPGKWDAESSLGRETTESHRTVQRLDKRRYHDRAGAWRETKQNVCEPRVSISREFALGQFSPTGSTLVSPPRTSTISSLGAEEHLHLIQHASQHSPSFSELDENDSQAIHTALDGSGLEADLDVVESGSQAGRFGGRGPQDMNVGPQPQRGVHRSWELFEGNPFFEGNSSVGAVSIPSMDIANADRRPRSQEGRLPVHAGASYSEASLESGIGQWAPSLPFVHNSTSSLSPIGRYQQAPGAYHRVTGAGEGLSNSLPTSHANTLRPPSWRPSSSSGPDGYSSQPMSRNTSSGRGQDGSALSTATSHSLPITRRRAPSTAATEPSPSFSATDNVPTSYQAWQLRHAGRRSQERAPRRDVALGSSSQASKEGVEMVRSGSGGVQFNGRIVEFGHPPPRTTSTPGYPRQATEATPMLENDDEIESPERRPVGFGTVAEPRRRGEP